MRQLVGALGFCAIALCCPIEAVAKYSQFGAGTASCGRYLHDVDAKLDELEDFIEWTNGFATAWSYQTGREFAADNPGMMAWLTNYCRSNPLDKFGIAAAHLMRELESKSQ